jgi:hypothetical protein
MKLKTSTQGLVVFLLVLVFGFMLGSYILTACFFGALMLLGLIVLIESIQPVKWLFSRSSKVLDAMIFVFTIIATMSYGLTISASLTVAGLGYTLFYGPYLREQLAKIKAQPKKRNTGNYRSKFNFK